MPWWLETSRIIWVQNHQQSPYRYNCDYIMDQWSDHVPLQWRHTDHGSVSNHQPHGCLLNRLFRRRSKKTSKLPVTGLCAWNSPGTGEFPAQMASNAENVSIWWRHHAKEVQRSAARCLYPSRRVCIMTTGTFCVTCVKGYDLRPLSLTWINFNSSIEK